MTTKAEWLASRCPSAEGPPMTMEREQIVRSLHWLLAQLHMSLATNKAPDPEVEEIAENIAAWWGQRQSAEPLPRLCFNEAADQLERASNDLYEARDMLVAWGAYASPEMQEKHDLEGDVARIGLAALEAKRIAREAETPATPSTGMQQRSCGMDYNSPQQEGVKG